MPNRIKKKKWRSRYDHDSLPQSRDYYRQKARPTSIRLIKNVDPVSHTIVSSSSQNLRQKK